MSHTVRVLESLGEIHEPATLGVDRPACLGKLPNPFSHGSVFGKPSRMELGIAAAKVETVNFRQLAPLQRTPEDQLSPSLAQHLEILDVIELECLVVSDADSPDPRRWLAARRRRQFDGCRESEQAVEVERTLDGVAETPELLWKERPLHRGDESEVALGEHEAVVAR